VLVFVALVHELAEVLLDSAGLIRLNVLEM